MAGSLLFAETSIQSENESPFSNEQLKEMLQIASLMISLRKNTP
jgi:hypothetical protein